MKLIPKNHSISNPTPAQIRAQRDRIMASKGFSGSKRQCAFLGYVVNAALEGQTDRLKEFTLGIEVFEKDESFDPSIDSIVRVEASRLRSKLSEYYVGVGQADSVRIDIPKGHYVPFFRLVDIAKVERRLSQKFESSVKKQIEPSPSSIAVLPLRDWSRLPEECFSEAMTDALISSLAEIGTLGVTSLTSVMRYKNTEIPIPEIGRTLGVAYILEGSVFRDGEQVRLTAQLIDANTDKHVWSKRFDRPSPDLLSVQSEVTATIAAHISNEMATAGGACPIMMASAF